MIRDLPRLADREFDVLVVGGGIYGLTIAYDAAQRGLSVALVERGDFGAATSFNHLKTIHGGLRYLQSGDIRRMRESILERRTFARIAPRFVAPLAFAMPTGPSLTRNPIALKIALAIDAYIARDRNDGVDPTRRLTAGSLVAGQKCRTLFDGAVRTVASAAVWYDYATIDGDRLTLSFARAAAANGAALANYVEAQHRIETGDHDRRFRGVRVVDKLTGEQFDVRARMLVNAAGPWTASTLADDRSPRWPLLKAMNLVTSRPAREAALVAPTRSGRALVLLPWRGRTLVGTSESADERTPDDQAAKATEVDEFLTEIHDAFPMLGLKASEVTLVHRGIVPATPMNGRLGLLGSSRVIDHANAGSPEVVSVVGVKYTTARVVAERVVDLIARKLERRAAPCRTAVTPLPGAALHDPDPEDAIGRAVTDEMAHTLIDVVVRRTGLGAAGYPGDGIAEDAADRVQRALGWSDARRADELGNLKRFYEVTS